MRELGRKEKQSHGFIYEKEVIWKYGLRKAEGYTAEFDAFLPSNNIPISIKTCKWGSSVCLGDYFRQKNINKDFILIVGFWKDKNTKEVFKEDIFYITNEEWNNITWYDNFEKIKNLFNNISNSKEDDLKWKERLRNFKRDIKEEAFFKVTINPKRDSKNQKRIQCSISKSKYVIFSKKWTPVEIEKGKILNEKKRND